MSGHMEAIAVVGLSCRLPGGIESPSAFFRALLEGRDLVRKIPADRLDPALFTDIDLGDGRSLVDTGGFLDDVTGFDADFFEISAREAAMLDPQQRLLLEVSWHALEHAGIVPAQLVGSRTGVFTGLNNNDYMLRLAGRPDLIHAHTTLGTMLSAGSGRVSFALGLRGPSVVVETGCSASLVAVHLACQSLRAHESDLAIANGAHVWLSPESHLALGMLGALSRSAGRCRSFDITADGFVPGEGAGAVVLKRLSDAEREGDRVLAVIRGSATNHSGRSGTMSAPSRTAQEQLLTEALRRAAIDPGDVGLVEAHGPGTELGDPIEFSALNRAYGTGRGRCALGAVKSNVGHLEAAAGVLALIKAVLCVQHGVVPRNLHFTTWNANISAEGSRLFVPTATVPWPVTTQTRLAAVSAFGLAGTNAHLILAAPTLAATLPKPAPQRAPEIPAAPEVFVLSAGSARILPVAARQMADWLAEEGSSASLRDIAHTLALRRPASPARLGVVASSRDELSARLRAFGASTMTAGVVTGTAPQGHARRPVWVFSGHGSQWAGMGRDLLITEPVFAETLARLDPWISRESGLSVLDIVSRGRRVERFDEVQPTIFALQVALAETWRSYGVQPAAVIGNSMGEVAAAVAAGALSMEDGVRVICRRSRIMMRLVGAGVMATVELSPAAVEAELSAAGITDVSVAVWTAPTSTVVGGAPGSVERLLAGWSARGVIVRHVAVDVASHTPQVEALLADMITALEDLAPRAPDLPFYTTVLASPGIELRFDAAYWAANLRNPVRFSAAVAAAATDGHRVFLEVAPHPIAAYGVKKTLASMTSIKPSETVVLSTLQRGEHDPTSLRTNLAALHCAGVRIDWQRLYAGGSLIDLPATVWDRRRHWFEVPRPSAAHALLGVHVAIPGEPGRHVWQNEKLTLPWLFDHVVAGDPMMPGAAYCEMALAAGGVVFGDEPSRVCVEDIEFQELLRLGPDTRLSTIAEKTSERGAEVKIFALSDGNELVCHAVARLRHEPAGSPSAPPALEPPAGAYPSAIDPAGLYAHLREIGIDFGPSFLSMTGVQLSDADPLEGDAGARRHVQVTVEVPRSARKGSSSFVFHPVLLDGCLQSVLAAQIQAGKHRQGLILPIGIRTLRVHGDTRRGRYCRCTMVDGVSATAVIHLLDAEGAVLAEIDGLRLIGTSRPLTSAMIDDRLYAMAAESCPRGEVRAPPRGPCLIVGEGDEASRALATALRRADGEVREVEGPLTADHAHHLADCRHVLLMLTSTAPATGAAAAKDRVLRLTRTTQTLIRNLLAGGPRLWVITRGAQVLSADDTVELSQTGLPGLARVINAEYPELRLTQVDFDPGTDDFATELVAELAADRSESEIAFRGGERRVIRLVRAPLSASERRRATERRVRYGQDAFFLDGERRGDLDTLTLYVDRRRRPAAGEVEVQVLSAGINFHDLLSATGLLPGAGEASEPLGGEGAGVVTAVGPEVSGLREGDRVVFTDWLRGTFRSFVTVPEARVVPLPSNLDLVAAAGVPAVYMTAWYALCHLARLQAGERVLIHSAAGGTGLAAIDIARRLGAEVLATAGSERKRRYLRALGIKHVMDSRSLDFVEEVREATGGEGVDVVLNSLTGPAIRAGLTTLRFGGRFLELTKRDIYTDMKLGMFPFRKNITLSSIDLELMQKERPALIGTLLREVFEEITKGRLTPGPHTTFPLERAASAFRRMAAAQHIGKLILTFPQAGETVAHLPEGDYGVVQPGGGYIVTGGLRGLGLEVARWLVARGAGRVVVNGRTAPSEATEAVLAEMRGTGREVRVILGDVAAPGVAERLVAAATEGGVRLRGVVHSAVVMRDAAVANITEEQVEQIWRPKVAGAWALHEASMGHVLDFFVLFSSASSLLGVPGMGSYAAANAWLDGFAVYRRSQGLPALSVSWGAWGETGIATSFAARGYDTIRTEEGLWALEVLLAHGRRHTCYAAGSLRTWVPAEVADTSSLFATLFTPAKSDQATSSIDIRAVLAEAEDTERRTMLEAYVTEQLRDILQLDAAVTIERQVRFSAFGLDSLLSLEFRRRLEKGLGVSLPATIVLDNPTIAELVPEVASRANIAIAPPNRGGLHGAGRS